MQKIMFISVFAAFSLVANAQTPSETAKSAQNQVQTGIDFQHSTWSEIMAKAKAENKLVFLDAYTTWCGPCKWMTANVFPNDTIGQFFNKNFVNAKMDMEKGEGVRLAQQYRVQAYPTYLFINGEGEVVHQAAGAMGVKKFLAIAEDANNPLKQMGAMDKRFKAGERDPQFLFDMAYAKTNAAADPTKYAEAFLEAEKDWAKPNAQKIIFDMIEDPEHKAFQYFITNRKGFEETFGVRGVANKLSACLSGQVVTIVNNNPKDGWEKATNFYKKYFGDEAEQRIADFKVEYYTTIGDKKKATEAMGDYVDKYAKDDWSRLNEAAWAIFEDPNADKKMLAKAVKWGEKSVKINSNFFNNDTVANLYFRTDNKKKAKAAAEEAIAKAKQFGNDPAETEALLKKIEMMRE
jgi:thiol-disulfide isomerase/thioredoxin